MIRDYAMGESIVSDDSEVGKILSEAYEEVKVLYESNKSLIEKAYEVMLDREVLHKEDIKSLKNEIF